MTTVFEDTDARLTQTWRHERTLDVEGALYRFTISDDDSHPPQGYAQVERLSDGVVLARLSGAAVRRTMGVSHYTEEPDAVAAAFDAVVERLLPVVNADVKARR